MDFSFLFKFRHIHAIIWAFGVSLNSHFYGLLNWLMTRCNQIWQASNCAIQFRAFLHVFHKLLIGLTFQCVQYFGLWSQFSFARLARFKLKKTEMSEAASLTLWGFKARSEFRPFSKEHVDPFQKNIWALIFLTLWNFYFYNSQRIALAQI